MDAPAYAAPAAAEVDGLADVLSRAFGAPARDGWAQWLREDVGLGNARILREAGACVAGLALVPMGQHFGGRSVPMTGLAGVGTPPERRGHGSARRLLEAALHELHAGEVALSTLFPSTLRPYRGVGYEVAGSSWDVVVPAASLEGGPVGAEVVRVPPGERGALHATYDAFARPRPGLLDRGPYVWKRIFERDAGTEVYGVRDGERWAGYVVMAPVKRPDMSFDLVIADLAATDAGAARRLLGFLFAQRSVGRDVRLRLSPTDPLLGLLPEARHEVRRHVPWMLRVVHVPRALAARGWPAGVIATLDLEVRDPLLPENDGRFRLHLSDGVARVERGGDGRLALSVQALAPLYSGHHGAAMMRQAGWLAGDDATIRTAEACFAGPAPWSPDRF